MVDNIVKIYHNPRCSKSRQTLALLEENGVKPEIIEYLKTPLDEKELGSLVAKLKLPAKTILRSKEEEFKLLTVNVDDDSAVIAAIAKTPKLMERPIVVKGPSAAIGRPPENVLKLL